MEELQGTVAPVHWQQLPPPSRAFSVEAEVGEASSYSVPPDLALMYSAREQSMVNWHSYHVGVVVAAVEAGKVAGMSFVVDIAAAVDKIELEEEAVAVVGLGPCEPETSDHR